MQHESNCVSTASSETSQFTFDNGASYGLLQINGKAWCGKLGLSSDSQTCKSQLLSSASTDIERNINIGAQILSIYYGQYSSGVAFNGCNVQKTYTGWAAALRAYNGLGCNKLFPSQDSFVDDVSALYNKLAAINS